MTGFPDNDSLKLIMSASHRSSKSPILDYKDRTDKQLLSYKVEEKKLKVLTQQLFGKTQHPQPHPTSTSTHHFQLSYHTFSTEDIKYLKTDLFKILLLSSTIIAFQLLLYYLQQNHLITIPLLF